MTRLWTVMDLCERWEMTVDAVERTVRQLGVPFIELRTRSTRGVSWQNMRFRPEAVERWEAKRETLHPSYRKPADEKPAGKPTPSRPAEFKHLGTI